MLLNPAGLEIEFHSQLQLSRVMSCEHLSEGAAEQIGIYLIEIGVIEDVKRFNPELHTSGFTQLHVLEDRQVPALQARSFYASGPCIPRTNDIRVDICKDRGVEPLVCCVRRAMICIA